MNDDIIKLVSQVRSQALMDAHELITKEIKRTEEAAKTTEDFRANRRNRNRGLTMVVALIGAFGIPTALVMAGLHMLMPYAAAFTILPDCGITIYAWIKKY